MPIFLRITSGRKQFVPGLFNLGKWYMPIGIIAVSWVTFIVILLLFPASSSVTAQSMSKLFQISFGTSLVDKIVDYAVVIIMAVFIFASVSWVISAHKWFIGPIKTINRSQDSTPAEEKRY